MASYKRKKKILLYCNPLIQEALINNIKNCYFERGETLLQIREYKPNIIIFDREAEGIVKYANKKTYLMFLSNESVFTGVIENGFEAKHIPNPSTPEGKKQVEDEFLVQNHTNSLILRMSYILDNKDLLKIIEDIHNNKKINNQLYVYPMIPNDVSKVLDTLISLQAKGIAHLRGAEKTTFFKMACILAEKLKLPTPQSYYAFGKTINVKLAGIILKRSIREYLMKGNIDDKNTSGI